jgi:hypothetical protein
VWRVGAEIQCEGGVRERRYSVSVERVWVSEIEGLAGWGIWRCNRIFFCLNIAVGLQKSGFDFKI